MVKTLLDGIDLNSIRGILWDLDNTIYPYEPAHLSAYKACMAMAFEKYGISNSDFETHWKTARATVHKQLHGQAASHSRLLYFQTMHEQLFLYSNPQFSLEMESMYWTTFINDMEWKPGIEAFMKKAKKMGLKMCLVTDLTAGIQFLKWQKLNLGRYLDFMISSEEAGAEKPASPIFDLALKKIGLQADQVIMIGDNKEKDIAGAENMGIQSVWIQ